MQIIENPGMNTAAVVILYYPDEITSKRILSYCLYVQKIILIDNSEDNTKSRLLPEALPIDTAYVYMHDGENQGIAKRLNQAAALALQEGFDWLLTMDQDSYFSEHTIPLYFHCIEDDDNRNQTAMFGARFTDQETTGDLCSSVKVPHLITSGSMLNLSLFRKTGGFDEALFIDKVDFEYCFKAQVNGFTIAQFNNIFFHHNLGNKISGRSLKNGQITSRVLHSPVRMYYIVRNYFYLKSLYPGQFTESFADMKKEIFNRLKNNLIYGSQRLKLIRFLLRSYGDFKAGNMGKMK